MLLRYALDIHTNRRSGAGGMFECVTPLEDCYGYGAWEPEAGTWFEKQL